MLEFSHNRYARSYMSTWFLPHSVCFVLDPESTNARNKRLLKTSGTWKPLKPQWCAKAFPARPKPSGFRVSTLKTGLGFTALGHVLSSPMQPSWREHSQSTRCTRPSWESIYLGVQGLGFRAGLALLGSRGMQQGFQLCLSVSQLQRRQTSSGRKASCLRHRTRRN